MVAVHERWAGVEIAFLLLFYLKKEYNMDCICGFKFSGPGEFRNCEAFILDGQGGVICPNCGREYIGNKLFKDIKDKSEEKPKDNEAKGD